MADLKISQLTNATTPLAGTEVLPIVQSGATVKVATDNLTVKNVRSNATTGILQIAGPGTGTTRTMTTPDANFTAARTDAAQSFTGDQTLSTGNLIQGTAAKGINFTANSTGTGSMSSQLLNWYEEGTWTPTLGGNATYTNRTARYTRIGRQVTLSCDMTVNAIGTGSTTLITGVPWSAGAFFNAGSVSYWSNTNGNYIYITPLLAYGSIQFNTTASATSAISDTTAIFKNDTRVIFTITYFV